MNNSKVRNRKTRKVQKKEKPKTIKGFRAVEWVRKVRDKMYEKNKNLEMSDYVKKILNDD